VRGGKLAKLLLEHEEKLKELRIDETVPGWAYCTEYCHKGLNISELISLYNEYTFTGGGFLAPMKISALPKVRV